jgi:hypothetical protein
MFVSFVLRPEKMSVIPGSRTLVRDLDRNVR